MAREGARVLIVEKEIKFRDRVTDRVKALDADAWQPEDERAGRPNE